MRSAIAIILAVVLAVLITGCGGGSEKGDGEGLSLLLESEQAMMVVSGYRTQGTIDMDMGGQGEIISMEVRAEVQNVDGDMRQHMFMSLGGYEVESFIVGGVYYQNMPGTGWMKQSTGVSYMGQNTSLGMLNAEQMELMAQVAKDTEVVEEGGGIKRLSFRLDDEYARVSLERLRKMKEEGDAQFSEEELRMAEEYLVDFQAAISMWIRDEDKLVQRMEMSYAIGGTPEVGDLSSVAKLEVYDYGADIKVELPPEAEQAQEYELTQ